MIGTKIKQLRTEKGWTTRELAEKAGITQAMVVNYENGKSSPKGKVLTRLSNTFGIAIDELLEARAKIKFDQPKLQHEFASVLKETEQKVRNPMVQNSLIILLKRLLLLEQIDELKNKIE